MWRTQPWGNSWHYSWRIQFHSLTLRRPPVGPRRRQAHLMKRDMSTYINNGSNRRRLRRSWIGAIYSCWKKAHRAFLPLGPILSEPFKTRLHLSPFSILRPYSQPIPKNKISNLNTKIKKFNSNIKLYFGNNTFKISWLCNIKLFTFIMVFNSF